MSRPLSLLLVEDSDDDAELLLITLRQGGFNLHHQRVEDEDSMRQALEEGEWDILISDYSLPRFSGLDALRMLKDSGRDFPAIIISGTVGEEIAVETLRQGASDYLLKQNLTRLIPAVQRALEEAENQRKRKAAEHMNTLIMSNSVDVICVIDEKGCYRQVSTASERLWGFWPSEMIDRHVIDHTHSDDREYVQKKLDEAKQEKPAQAFECRMFHKDGSIRHTAWSSYWSSKDALIFAVARDITERKEREETLRLREQALGEVSQGVIISDENRHVIYANASFSAITGYSEKEVLGQNCDILEGTGTDPEIIKKIHAAVEAEVSFEGEVLNYRKNGSSFWNELSVTPIRDKRGGPIRFIDILRDVTARKESESALQQSEERFRAERALLRALIDSIPDLIFFKDRDSVFLGCNKAFEKHLGISEQDLIGCNDFALVPPEVARFYRRKDQDLFSSGRAQRMEEWIPSKNGHGGFYETMKTPYRGPAGENVGIIGVSRDITERKEAEENMRIVLDRLRIAARAAQAGIWELDLRTNETTWDDQMCILFGLTPGKTETTMTQWFRLMHGDDVPRLRDLLSEAQHHSRDSFDIEFRIVRADNKMERLIQTQGLVKRDAQGMATGLIGTNRDVTEERSREKELAKALAQEKELSEKARAGERAKGEFLAVMSHELRTPMNGILGFAELLCRSSSLPPECRDFANTILHSGEALLRILDDILDFSRLEDGHLKIESTSFSPRKLITDIRHLLERQAQTKYLDFEVLVDEAVPETLEGDAGRIRQILLNLLGNAIKFTEQGKVTLHMSMGDAMPDGFWRCEFRVRDTGSGIPEDKIEAIFQPFTQADSSISRRHGGTGLGLTISRRLTEVLGGTLTVKSEVGVGSEFLALIPLATSERPPQACNSLPSASVNIFLATKYPLRILVAEDDKVNLKLVQALIGKLGYASLAARNGSQAVDIFRVERPDCILMDLQMPEMGGIEATEKIRDIESTLSLQQTYICALTANIFPADRQRCFLVGMNGYLNKPVKIASLAESLIQAAKFRQEHKILS